MDEGLSYQFAPVNQKRPSRHELNFDLTLRQQPKQSRMCGIGEKADRRPIDPPPIIQLRVSDASVKLDKTTFLYNPYYFMYASLMLADSDEEMHLLHDGKTRSTTGSLVSSLYHLKDVNNSDGGFFVFPDLSVRMEGRYRLKFTLFEIVGMEVFFCRSICSDIFTVYSAKRFPGMEESTFLSRSFADQGLKIRIRKEVRIRRRGSKWKDAVGSPSERDHQKFESKSPPSVKAPDNDNKESEGSAWSEEDNIDVDERRKRFSEDKGYSQASKRRSVENSLYLSSENTNSSGFPARSSQHSYSPGSLPPLEQKKPIRSSNSSQNDSYSPMLSKSPTPVPSLQWQHPPQFNYNAPPTRLTSNIQNILNSEQPTNTNFPSNQRNEIFPVLTASYSLTSLPSTTPRSDSKSVLSIQNIISPQNGPYPAPIPDHPFISASHPEVAGYGTRQEAQSYPTYRATDKPYGGSHEKNHQTYSPGATTVNHIVSSHAGWSENYTPAQSSYPSTGLPDHGYSHISSSGSHPNTSISRLPNISSLINPSIQPPDTLAPQYHNPNTSQPGNRSNRYNQFQ
ncbi:hypothetical protein K7432_010782 [Basidiobolus ranarum]|uniref:Velvet domain-containing protein n=1 Tax=Basidiobolus ranarum TaxID=34480 RepID=A0ABR2WN96_9FUNG